MSALPEIRDLVLRHVGRPTPAGLVLHRADAPTEPMPSQSAAVFALVVQGAKRATLGARLFAYGAGQFVVASMELPVIAQISEASPREPYLVLGLTLRPPLVAELLLDMPPRAGGPAAGIAVSTAGEDLLDAVVRLLRLLDRPDDQRVLWAALEREVVWRLLTGEQGGTVRQVGLGDSNIVQIERAIRWIREHHADLFRVEDAARVAGMSLTSFHRHFRAVTTMTPIQFQKLVRLQEARTRLLAAPGDVAAVGFAVGYESASQFSREYRRLFGLPPGQDAARLAQVGLARLGDGVV
ncbi:AraC family transcriptional regulator N-terminal domain-containing protein [Micromonospora krabiensis]|uniref:AraC-type DNA-binding protein n=1 Tax=Micromonospora krabiensis TaxID=307121 RepID=A0A1C3NAE2_9ACTN|nr:AraC family transcriptional regulator [Micromonospora krabiensis]SBV29529.1 AraC-type DNA-binding protein [Micromonospora krabiensis]